MPDLELLLQLGHNQISVPGAFLLGLDYVAEYVITNVEHVLTVRVYELRKDVAVAARVDTVSHERSRVTANVLCFCLLQKYQFEK